MAKESQLSERELASLRLTRFIFHVWNPNNEAQKLRCLDTELTMDGGDTQAFFEARLRDAAKGTQFVFSGTHLPVKNLCQRVIDDSSSFVAVSKELTEAFTSHHRGRRMAAGVIIIAMAQVEVQDAIRPLVFILKVDHKPAMTYTLATGQSGDTTASMQHILDALVEDKAAVQRSAIVDVSPHYAWDVLAAERNEGAAPELREFFKAFLGVEPREDASVLTRRTVTAVSTWAKGLAEEDRPEDEPWRRYRERATQYMRVHTEFETEAFLEMVVRDEDANRKARASHSLREHLREQGIAGQRFAAKPGSLHASVRKTKLVTFEGVTVTYEGDRWAARLEVIDDPQNGAGAKQIVIRTQHIEERDGG